MIQVLSGISAAFGSSLSLLSHIVNYSFSEGRELLAVIFLLPLCFSLVLFIKRLIS